MTRGVRSDVFETEIADPERTYKKIFDLKDDTEYEITIWALTAAGEGQPKVIVEVTVPSSGRQSSIDVFTLHIYGRPVQQMRTVYFCPVVSFFYLLSSVFFIPRLISAVADWMSTIFLALVRI